jgi:hypothetical protein
LLHKPTLVLCTKKSPIFLSKFSPNCCTNQLLYFVQKIANFFRQIFRRKYHINSHRHDEHKVKIFLNLKKFRLEQWNFSM